jgi:ubiquinone/menaquinone biosynthesis C-methylase UbiE
MNMETRRQVTYDHFAQAGWYRDVNLHLAALSGVKPGDRVLDIGAGSGSSTAIILDRLNSQGEVIAIDRNNNYLAVAMQKLSSFPNVSFLEADALHLAEVVKGTCDGAFIFNAIHLMSNHPRLFEQLFLLLKPGGFLAFNTTYFTENNSPLRSFQSQLLLEIVRRFKRKGKDFGRREQMSVCSVEHYKQGMERAGFEIVHHEIADIAVEAQTLTDFYRDGGVADFLAADLSPEEIEDLIIFPLQELIKEMECKGIKYLPNKWLNMVAHKKTPEDLCCTVRSGSP